MQACTIWVISTRASTPSSILTSPVAIPAIMALRFRNSLCFFSVAMLTRFAGYSLPPIFRVKSDIRFLSVNHPLGNRECILLVHPKVFDLLVSEWIAERDELLDRLDRLCASLRDEDLAAAEVQRLVGLRLEIVRQRV